ncbi:MAG: RNA pyrophosphohydrolase [Parvibaculaceae bacterium]
MPETAPPRRPYRRCAGIMLVNNDGKVWVGNRIGTTNPETLSTWQMPQGGIDKGESPAEAAVRELKEEVGTDKAEIVAESAEWYNYDLPAPLQGKALKGKYRGQTQRWFVMRFTGTDADIDIAADDYQEFSEWRWADIDELADLIVDFKRPVYVKVVEEFRDLVASLKA